MKTFLLFSIVWASLASGHAIICRTCAGMISDDPSFPVPVDPGTVTCSETPQEKTCEEGVTSCMTTIVALHFARASGPLTLTQEVRDCGPWISGVLPSGDTCAGEDIVKTILGPTDASTMFPPELGLTYESQDASICLCDSSDNCIPPSPGMIINTTDTTEETVPPVTSTSDVPSVCPIAGEWYVDWDNSFACLSQYPISEPFEVPGQILPRLAVSDVIEAAGAAWKATSLIEAEGEVCVRVLPQLTVAPGGLDIVRGYCDPVLSFLREGTSFDALAHCRYILNITGAMSSYMPQTFPTTQPLTSVSNALRPFDFLDHIEKIIYNLVGVSFNDIDNVCTARVGIVESESSLKELTTDFLVAFTKVLIPRAAELCETWDDLVNGIVEAVQGDNAPDMYGVFQNTSNLLAHLSGFTDRNSLCQDIQEAFASPPESPAVDHVAAYITNSTLDILTDVSRCSIIAQEALDIFLALNPELTHEQVESALFQYTGFRSVQDVCQEIEDAFLPEVEVRLVGGSDNTEGTVEVLYNGVWGTVCDDSWDIRDANVVCRMLGFPKATRAPLLAHFGIGTGIIWLDDVMCSGVEENIADCQHREIGESDCRVHEAAGVVCLPQEPAITEIRLVDGGSDYEGRVEIEFEGQWGTICDDDWDLDDASVACRMLGFTGATDAPLYGQFGPGSGTIWLDQVGCTGNETTLADCYHDGFGETNCDHYEDACVICIPPVPPTPSVEVRLFGGADNTEGTVEVFYDGQWGTVCDDYWDLNDANVVCRMLGFTGASAAPGYARFGEGSGEIWLDDVVCSGREQSIAECQHPGFGVSNCAHYEDAGVVCVAEEHTITDIRLVGGESDLVGRVEIEYDGEWGTICDDVWGLDDANVVCRMLGFDGASGAPGSARFGQGSGNILLDDVECLGNEVSLTECSHLPFKEHNCDHSEDAGVICVIAEPQTPKPSPFCTITDIRLVGGGTDHEGRVEIYYKEEWGTVCDDGWGIDDASVACRMLGFDGASNASGLAEYGEGSGRIWLDDVECIGDETTLLDCNHRTPGQHNCGHSEDAGVTCFSIEPTIPETTPMTTISTTPTPPSPIEDIRLSGSTISSEGRVEILYNGEWGTICDDYWDQDDADVACRMLGFEGATSAPGQAQFGEGSGAIWLDNVRCVGTETSLADCPRPDFGDHNCGHSEDAGVVCLNTVTTTIHVTTVSPWTAPVRLVNGGSPTEGRVEILHNGQWGTICDDYWDLDDATVVCSMLGFGRAVDAPTRAHFGQGTDPIWLDDVRCVGDESELTDCPRNAFGTNNCGHSEDAGVICSAEPVPEQTVRLVNGDSDNNGRVEIYHDGEWGSICDDYWGLDDATVVCRMLGFGVATEAPGSARYGQASGRIWLDDVQCSGSEADIRDCSHRDFGSHNCGHSEDAGAVCSYAVSTAAPTPPAHTVRLVGGNGDNEGRVEIFINGEWGTVCDDSWGKTDADIVCRMLGYCAASIAHGSAYFGAGEGQIWLDDVACTGEETDLLDCPHRGVGIHNCNHNEDAGVVCFTNAPGPVFNDIRLSGGTSNKEGRVEILHEGLWGTVCDDLWGIEDASVVCRMLGFCTASSAPGQARFGPGSDPIWLDDVSCTGSENDLRDCQHRGFGSHNCGHSEDAGVICIPSASIPETTTPDATTTESAPPPTTTPMVTTPMPRQVRLVGGNVPSRGRVEVTDRYGNYGTICDTYWSQNDADVVCRMLGYGGASSYSNNAEFGQSRGRILLDDVQCNGQETNIANCQLHPNGGWNCDKDKEVGVTCSIPEPSEFEIRLVGGSYPWEGRVELFYQGEWGTICSSYWGKKDGDVACKMLGFSSAYEAISPTGALYPMPFGEGTGTIHFSEFGCDGTEENLADCSHSGWGQHNCYHYEDAGLICNSPDPVSVVVRLVNGSSKAEGRVEVLYDGEFGTVCDDSWDTLDAAVVCRMLGYEGASQAPGYARFGQGSGDIVLDDVVCQGTEDNIASCVHRSWGEHNCGHTEDASVVCTGDLNLPVRLVNGATANEGRVEIFRYGAWGSVCDDFWDINDGHVVCRMLGYERAERIWWGTTYGPGSGRILLDNVECTGSEATLDDCDHPPWGVHDCNHYEDAGVVCK
ncbi:deleted in malignant brain tumors 1 protein-like [Lytechinus variegatus]|uniref:deleted in malignant brain tumors 1 protein-like n=1 Tax=Lytechinus variegatus TaxID=7654 RepID=UPI001BB10A00|nr:deleted in malignant brain tumors 1 protein-like [Lytechinus variegatus]